MLAALLVSLTGCASIDPYTAAPMRDHLERQDQVGACARLFRELDARIDAAGVRDAQAPRVSGFPYLRVDRFVQSLSDFAAALPEGFQRWSELMAGLDRAARKAELANARQAGHAAALDDCRSALALADSADLPRLRAAARVSDDYSSTLRALGLYPLTRLAFAAGIQRWHTQTQQTFAGFAAARGDAVPRLRYAPDLAAAPVWVEVPVAPAFDLPQRSPAQWQALLLRHAPQLAIQTHSDDDRLGRPLWHEEAGQLRVRIDTQAPVAFARVAFARWQGRIVPQLVYTVWFAARTSAGAWDLLAGPLDALIWRVTLDETFEPLVFDSIHACGCYHLFFPTDRVRARPAPVSLDEGLFSPQSVRAPGVAERMLLHVAARTHYLQHIGIEPAGSAATPYRLHDEDELRRLPLPGGGSRSLYGPDGLVAGSQRGERFFFWPMGISSAGQMRQWGRHATAFVGRRHFDDPWLIERSFEAVAAARPGAGADRSRIDP